jgi:hypothetical protein
MDSSPRWIAPACLGLLLTLLIASPGAAQAPLTPEEQERADDVREAALRWAFQNNGTDLRPPAAHCIAGPEGRASDPTAEFLSRFGDSAVPARPVSACEVLPFDEDRSERMRHNIVDRETGGFALYFETGRLAWVGDSVAEIDVQYGQGGLWGTGWRCGAVRTAKGEWRITACRKTVDR